jgi:hypothetical protein
MKAPMEAPIAQAKHVSKAAGMQQSYQWEAEVGPNKSPHKHHTLHHYYCTPFCAHGGSNLPKTSARRAVVPKTAPTQDL